MKIKVITLILLTYSMTIFGQTKLEIEAKNFFWGADDMYKNSTDIPDKWKNESAVVIYKNVNYDYHKFGKKVKYKTSIRKRIKLLDNAAVKEFSEFTFKKRFRTKFSWFKRGKHILGIKIIKLDGKEIEIDVNNDAVEVDGESKIAIANLEVGDILDYYFYKVEPFKSVFAFGFDPVETTLGEEYPVLDFKLFLETENDFFINFNSFNGSPELEEIATGRGGIRRYKLTASDIEKNDFPRWFYPLIDLPSYKFQVYFARSGVFENLAMAFLPKKEKSIKKTVSKEEVLDLYDKRFKPNGDIGDVKKFFKGKTFKSDKEKVIDAYYYMRHFYMTRYIEAMYVQEAGIAYSAYSYYDYGAVFIQDDKEFIRHFTEFLKRHKIKYEVVVAKKRYDGSIDDLLIESNVNVLLKIATEQPIYAAFFGPHKSINEYSPLVEGTDVYLLTTSKNKIDGVKKGKLPISEYSQNELKREITLVIDDDFSGLSVSSTSYYKGYTKGGEQYRLLQFDDYVYEDYKKYDTKSFIERVKKKKLKEKYAQELNALKEKLKEKQKEKFKKNAESEFDMEGIEDYEYEIINTGRYGVDSYFTFNETFKVNNAFIKRAGPNYIIEIGKFIGGQIDLTDKERKRTENIHMEYPRMFNYDIKIEIPEGYTVSGLDKLKKSVDNSTGAFISDANVEGNLLIINTTKKYKHNNEPNSNWILMIDFLDEANQFTNEKILLKRK